MYTDRNFKTKKELKAAVANGDKIGVYQPNDLLGRDFSHYNGRVTLEGPHFPKPHSWYAQAQVVDGVIVSIK